MSVPARAVKFNLAPTAKTRFNKKTHFQARSLLTRPLPPYGRWAQKATLMYPPTRVGRARRQGHEAWVSPHSLSSPYHSHVGSGSFRNLDLVRDERFALRPFPGALDEGSFPASLHSSFSCPKQRVMSGAKWAPFWSNLISSATVNVTPHTKAYGKPSVDYEPKKASSVKSPKHHKSFSQQSQRGVRQRASSDRTG